MVEQVREALGAAASRLESVSPTARLDAELLMARALGCTREQLLLARLDVPVPPGFAALVERRMAHEPIAYIIGTRDFWTITLKVGPGVLIPRPDSETLIEAAVAHFADHPPARILDLGTGPGTLLLAALAQWPEASGTGVERSASARAYAKANSEALGFAARARIIRGNWGAGVTGCFDLILCNPPYVAGSDPLPAEVVRWEPEEALFAGADGLDAYRALVPQLPLLIADGGAAILEIGHLQARAVAVLGEAAGLSAQLRHDLAGRPRALVLTPGR